jgi:hypothetical protein
VTFYLFTESDRNYHRIDHSNADEIAKGHAEIVFLIHGWSENRTAEWYHNLTEAFFARGGKKVIQVDYSSVATQIYPLAVEFSPRVGKLEIFPILVETSNRRFKATSSEISF